VTFRHAFDQADNQLACVARAALATEMKVGGRQILTVAQAQVALDDLQGGQGAGACGIRGSAYPCT